MKKIRNRDNQGRINHSKLKIGGMILLCSCTALASMTVNSAPRMNLTQDGFNSEQKLNLTIYNPKIRLTEKGVFTSPLGFYVYTNYPTKISEYQIAIYRASDSDNLYPLKTIRFEEISPYEAILWHGETDTGERLTIDTDYKAILTVKNDEGRRDEVFASVFKTLGYGTPEESDFTAYTRTNGAGFGTEIPQPDETYITVQRINGRLVNVVDLGKLAKLQDDTQDAFWQKVNHNNLLASPIKIAGTDSNVTSTTPDTQSLTSNLLYGQLTDSSEIPGFGNSRVDYQGITSSAQDRKVVVQMNGLEGKNDVMLNGEYLVVDNQGRAMREIILAPGEYDFNLSWTDEFGEKQSQSERLQIEKENDIFYVALIEATYAQNNVSGDGKSILQDADEHHYSGKGSWDGRVAFYLKANVDEYRITAHLDTTETKLKNAFGHIGEKDSTRFTRELDPEAYYPIYGDDSTTESDVDTEGRFYIKLEKGKNYALWGNYNTQITGNEFANFNRSLYGAKIYHENDETTEYGDAKSFGTLFFSTGETMGSHNELASTGGSLYYLKHQRITEGSLKLYIEIRDRNTGRVLSTETMTEGVDYEVNNFQGRIILTSAIPMTASGSSGSSIISGGNLVGGDPVWIIADYEYYSDGVDLDGQRVFGARGYRWLNDHIRIGGTYLNEDQSSGDSYQLQGLDLIIRPKKGTHTHIEYAATEAGLSDIFVSSNGGLSFNQASLTGDTKGAAWKIEQKIDFNEYTADDNDLPLTFSGYYSMQQQGFSSFSTARSSDLKEWGGELRYDFTQDQNGMLVSYSNEEDSASYVEKIARAQYFTVINEIYKGALELQHKRYDALNSTESDDDTKETLVAAKLETLLFDGRDKAYVIQQLTVAKSGDVENDNRTTVGYTSQITDSLNLGAEVFASNRGAGGGVQGAWDVNERSKLYTKVISDVDSNSGRGVTAVFGSTTKATSQMDLYSERQFKNTNVDRTTSDVYGVSYKPTESQFIEGSYSIGRVNTKNRNSTSLTGNSETRRDIYAVGYGYKNESFQIRNKLEYRIDEGNDRIRQWVTTNRAKTVISENLSWIGQFDFAKTFGSDSSSSDVVSNYTEAVIGFAYRPMAINDLNLFGKVTYVYGSDPDDQLIANSTSSNGTSYYSSMYDQKSWVWSLEGVYEWNANWETAFKAAHRQGHLRYKGESSWYSSGASLYAARVNYKFSDWEVQLEGRTLRSSLADDHKDGIVTSVYRNIGDNAKIGVGYNFTDYNDNLTHLNYNSHGWFVNVVGSF